MLNSIQARGRPCNLFRVCLNLLWAGGNVEIDQVIVKDLDGIFLVRI